MIGPERRASLDAILTIPPEPPAPPSSPLEASSELDPILGDVEGDKPNAAVGHDAGLVEYEWFLSPPKATAGDFADVASGDDPMAPGGYDAALFLPPDVLEALDAHGREAGSGAGQSMPLSEVNSLLETFRSARSAPHDAVQPAVTPDAPNIFDALMSGLERLEATHTATQSRLDRIDARLGELHGAVVQLGGAMKIIAAEAAREATLSQIIGALGDVQAELAHLRVATTRHEARRPRTLSPSLIDRDAGPTGPRANSLHAAPPSTPTGAIHAAIPEDASSHDGAEVSERKSPGCSPPLPPVTVGTPQPLSAPASVAAAVPVATLATPAPTPALQAVSTPTQARALTPPHAPARSPPQPSLQHPRPTTAHTTPRPALQPVSQYQPRPATASPQRRDHAVKSLPHVLRALRSGVENGIVADSVWPVDLDDFESEEGGTATPTPTTTRLPAPRTPSPVPRVPCRARSASVTYVDSQTPPPRTVKDKGMARARTAVKGERGTATSSKAVVGDAPKGGDKHLGKAVKVARSKTTATTTMPSRPPPHAPQARAKSAKRKREEERARTPRSQSTEGTQSKKRRHATLVIPQRDEALLAMSDGRRLGSGKWPSFPRDWNTWRMLKAAGREDEILPAPRGRCIRPDCCRRRKQKIDVKESDADEYVIKRVVGRCAVGRYEHGGRAFKYLVEWDGYPLNECTWEPARNLPRGNDGRCPFIDGFEADAQDVGVDLKNKVALLPVMGQWFDPDTGEPRAAPQ